MCLFVWQFNVQGTTVENLKKYMFWQLNLWKENNFHIYIFWDFFFPNRKTDFLIWQYQMARSPNLMSQNQSMTSLVLLNMHALWWERRSWLHWNDISDILWSPLRAHIFLLSPCRSVALPAPVLACNECSMTFLDWMGVPPDKWPYWNVSVPSKDVPQTSR